MADDSLLSADQKFALIEAVRDKSLLYDKINPDYHNKEKKDRVWAKIAEKPDVQLESGREAKEAWDRLRTLFKRNHNKKTSSGQGAVKEPRWQFYTAMSFLETHSEPRADVSNMEPEVALDLARLTAVYALWSRRRRSSRTATLAEPSKVFIKSERTPEPVKHDAYKRVVLAGDSSDSSDEDQKFVPPAKRPRRQAAVEAMERVRMINEYLRRERLLLSRPTDKKKISNKADAALEGVVESDASSQNAVLMDYEVEEVLDERWIGGVRQYLLQWVGDDTPTWEPAVNVDNCDGLLVAFNQDADPVFESDSFEDDRDSVVSNHDSDQGFEEAVISD